MKYEVNPCGACNKMYPCPSYNVDKINSCITDTTAAFSGYPSNDVIQGKNYANWKDCINQTVDQRIDDKYFNAQISMAPVFEQVPHYFPTLLKHTNNIEQAYNLCNEQCQTQKLKNECMKRCTIDAGSVIFKENFDDTAKKKDTTPVKKKDTTPVKKKDTTKKNTRQSNIMFSIMKSHPIAFWLSFVFFSFILIFVLYIFVKSLFTDFNIQQSSDNLKDDSLLPNTHQEF